MFRAAAVTDILALAPDPTAPAKARRFVAEALERLADDETREVATLLVSELVTNAVVHAASAVEVEIERGAGDVTVLVRDADTGPLVMRAGAGSELDEGGRGFILVDRLAQCWGTEHRGGRKTVWFRVPTGEPSVASTTSPSRALTADAAPPARTAERRLRTLLLRPSLQRALTFDQHLDELLARTIDALGANGAEVTLTSSADPVATQGAAAGAHTHSFELVVDDRRLGTFTVYVERELDDEDEAFLELAAERLSLLASEHGVMRAEQEREAKLDYLAEATEMLAGSLSVSLTLTLVTQIVVPRLADWCGVYDVDDRARPRRLTAIHRREDRTDAVNALLDGDPDIAAVVAAAAQGGAPQRLPMTVAVGGQRVHVVVLPLTSRSRTLGVLVMGRSQPLDAVGFMATLELTRRAALAVDNARLHEDQVAAANALQASLLPSALPEPEGLQLAARYHSASPGLSVGGDFYDAYPLPDGSFVFAIGDVCGKGAEAASVTGMSRDLLRLLLEDGLGLRDALRRLNRALLDHPSTSRFCTVALAQVRTDGADVSAQVCLAGHPEPVLLHADGSTELAGTTGDLLGVLPADTLELTECDVKLGPGDALVLYTDGVTERRDGRRMFGQYGLRQALERAVGADADGLAHEVEHAAQSFVDTDLRDDLAILVIRRPG